MTLLWSDPHITEKNLDELEKIFTEIISYSADKVIMLGDYWHRNKPTAKELLFGTKWAVRFKQKYKEVIFLRGNHDSDRTNNVIDYLQYFGIKIVDNYVDEYNNYYDHCMLYESPNAYGHGKIGIKNLQQYNYILLGHEHRFVKIIQNVYHIGSCVAVNYNEENSNKYFALYSDDKGLQFIPIKSVIPMISINSIYDIKKLNKNTKIKLIYNSWEKYKEEINDINTEMNKFYEYKIFLNFDIQQNNQIIINQIDKENIIKDYIDNIKDKDVKQLLKKVL